MKKQLTLLLVAVFSWLFVGSLIIFHQEHVLGKHASEVTHQFIVPKSKEEVGYCLKQLSATQKVNMSTDGFLVVTEYGSYVFTGIVKTLVASPFGLISDAPPGVIHGLRAPPRA